MLKKIIYLIFLIIIFYSYNLFAGTVGKISGNIRDVNTGEPIIGANIILEMENDYLGTASDINGYYVILNVPPGTFNLKVSTIGYANSIIKNVKVNMELTTIINVELTQETLNLKEIVVEAKRPIVKRDVSASELNIDAQKIATMPVSDVSEVIGLQAGIKGMEIRGGSSRQTAFIVDGFVQNDARSNTPYTSVSLSTVQEVKVQTGGFNAEYGNIRSGLINIVTSEGGRDNYSGALSIIYHPPSMKHFGESVYSTNSYFLRPYMDADVCYTGTNNGVWDEHTQKQYPTFGGWNALSEATLQDSDPSNDLTPEGAKKLFEWQHRRQGDIEKPDMVIDFGFGGPVPVISKYLGDLRFYASYRDIQEMFIIPLSRDSYDENVGRLKLTSNISSDIKLTFTGSYGEIQSASQYSWKTTPTGAVLRSDYGIANLASSSMLYMPGWFSPADIYRTILGVKLNHILNDRSYYEVKIQHNINRYKTFEMSGRDTSKVFEIIPDYFVDEAPYGYWGYGVGSIGDNIRLGGWMNLGRDKSTISTTTMKFDYVNQINNYNHLKTGAHLILNNYDIKSFTSNPGMTTWNRDQIYNVKPISAGAYIQDKLEFEGFITNIGLRFDYTDSKTDYYVLEDYDAFYKEGQGKLLEKEAPSKKAKARLKISPRLGIAHPITDNSKLYFNYGHFYTEPSSTYRFRTQREYNGMVTSIGNPNLLQEKTIAYEIGYSQNILDMFLLNIAGYYKDVSDQIGWIEYFNINNTINYLKPENNNYEDIRGFEITLDKRTGDWITGFINYTYMVNTSGYFGLREYYEDPNKQREYLLNNPYQSRPKPRPYIRANIDLHSPINFGNSFGGLYPLGGWNVNLLASWSAGSYATYNPGNILGVGVINNVQWKDTYNFDLRITKAISFKKIQCHLFCDIVNVFNTKQLSYAGFSSGRDYDDYMQSLRLQYEEGIEHGNDRIGEFREDNIAYDPLEANPNNDPEIEARNNKRIKNKSYIDMPNIKSLTFLNPMMINFGIKIMF